MAVDPAAIAAQHADNARQSAAAAQSAQTAAQSTLADAQSAQAGAESAKQATQQTAADLVKQLQLSVTKPTDKFRPWQQIPAWVVIGCALAGGACLIAFPHTSINQNNAWTGVIVTLLVGVFLSFRSAFTLGASSAGNAAATANKTATADGPAKTAEGGDAATPSSKQS
jgi:hypothetical protein